MEELQMLLYEQEIALKRQDYQLLNAINQKIFAIRQEQRNELQKQKQLKKEKLLSSKIDTFCEFERNL